MSSNPVSSQPPAGLEKLPGDISPARPMRRCPSKKRRGSGIGRTVQYYSASEEKEQFSIGWGIGRVMKTIVIPAAISPILIGVSFPEILGG
jgi:hypothetical protein